jgi:glycosyltransferase involved in cell wall biosynthesis
VIVTRWIIHGGADRSVLELLQGIKTAAPDVRRYLITTAPAELAWGSEVDAAADARFTITAPERHAAAHELAELIDRLDVDAVLIVNSMCAYDALPHILRATRVIAYLHGFMRDPPNGTGHAVKAATHCDHLIDGYAVIARIVADQLTELFDINTDKVHLHYCGINLEPFRDARRERFASDRRRRVLWLGRLADQKDPLTAVRVAGALRRSFGSDAIELRIVGDGELRDAVQHRVLACGLEDMVTLQPATDDPRQLYAWADCLLMTSRYEGIPYVIYQAMAAELPIVTPVQDTAITEILAPTDASFIRHRDDAQEYAAAIHQLAEQPTETAAAAARAANAATRHSYDEHISRMLELLFAPHQPNGDTAATHHRASRRPGPNVPHA